MAALLASLLPFAASTQAPAWHELQVANPVHQLALDEEGEGWAAAWDGATIYMRALSFPETGPPILDTTSFAGPSSVEPRVSLGDAHALVTTANGVLRWNGALWELRGPNTPMVDVRVDRLQPGFAIALPAQGFTGEQIHATTDGGLTWTPSNISTEANRLRTAALRDGAATVFNEAWSSPFGTLDFIQWTSLSQMVEILDATVLDSGNLVGVGRFGDYVVGPVGQGLVFHVFDPAQPHVLRVSGIGDEIWVLVDHRDSTFSIFRVPDPFAPLTRDALPPTGLSPARAIGASSAERLIVSGTTAGGVEVLLWRNRPPIPHPDYMPPVVTEGSVDGVTLEVALDPDGDEPTLLSHGCDLGTATTRVPTISPHGMVTQGELFVAVALPGLEAEDCPGLSGWPLHCSFEVTDGEFTTHIDVDGLVQSPGPVIASLEPASQEVETGSEATVEIRGLTGCKVTVTAEVWDGGALVLTEPDLQGEVFSFTPATGGAASTELTVVITAVDEDGREAQAGAIVVVNAPVLTVTAPSLVLAYGDEVSGLDPSYQGFVDADGPASLDAAPICVTTYGAGDPVGVYPIDCAGGSDSRYVFVYVSGTLTVEPAPLTITATDQSKSFGQAFAFHGTEFAVEGLIGAESVESVTLESDGAAAAAPAGTYPIVPSLAQAGPGTELSNYDVEYRPGVMTVLHLIPVVSRCERHPDLPYGLRAVLAEGSAEAQSFHWLIDLGDGSVDDIVGTSPEQVVSFGTCLHGNVISATVTPSSLDGVLGDEVACETMTIEHDGRPPRIVDLPGEPTLLLGPEGGSLELGAMVEDCPGDPVTVTFRLLDSVEGLGFAGLGDEELTDTHTETRSAAEPFQARLQASDEAVDPLLEARARVEVVAESEWGGPSDPQVIEIDFALIDDIGELISVRVDLFAPAARTVAPGELVTVFGHVTAEVPFALPGVAVELRGGMAVVPGTLRIFEDCSTSHAPGSESVPPAGAEEFAQVLEIGAVSRACRGISFLARQGLGPPSVSVEACTWTTPDGSSAPIADCTGGLESGGDRSLGCSCGTSPGGASGMGAAAGLLCLFVVLRFGSRRRAPRTRWAAVGFL